MKKILFVFVMICMTANTYSQEWTLEYSLGYGTFQLDDLKAMQEDLDLKKSDRFPGHITHSGALGYLSGDYHFGINFSYLTTSGCLPGYTNDMIVSGCRLGSFFRYYIRTEYSPLSVYLQLSPSVIFSNLKEDGKIRNEKSEFQTTGIFIEPTIGVSYRAASWLHFSLGGGYEVYFSEKLEFDELSKKMQWNGLRLYAGIMLFLPSHRKP